LPYCPKGKEQEITRSKYNKFDDTLELCYWDQTLVKVEQLEILSKERYVQEGHDHTHKH